MHRRRTFALGGVTLALVLAPAAALAATPTGGTVVTVRVEGLNRTLLAPTQAQTHPGSITKGGTPPGRCSATTAAGALDVATHHRWSGRWTGSQGLELTSIFGEAHPFTSKSYWSIWVDNRFAEHGLCGIRLHRGEQLLFAAVPDTFDGAPLVLAAPSSATAGRSFTVTVDAVTSKGKLERLPGARVAGHGVSATTNAHGVATVTAHHAGTLVLEATHAGDIRSAPDSVRVVG